MIKFKTLLASVMLMCGTASATEYRMVVPFGVGSHGDLTQRIIAERFHELTGDHIVIENKPGTVASPAINYMKVNRDIDLISLAAGILVVDPVLKEVSYTDEDYTPIVYVGTTPFVWISDNIATPEGMLKYGGEFAGGNAGTGEINLKFVNMQKNLNISYVPYKSAPDVIMGVASNQLHLANVGLNSSILQLQHTGKLHIVGSTYKRDIVIDGISIPSVPKRLGVEQLNGFTVIATRPGMDRAKQERLKEGLWKATMDAKTRERLRDLFFLDDASDDMVELRKHVIELRTKLSKYKS